MKSGNTCCVTCFRHVNKQISLLVFDFRHVKDMILLTAIVQALSLLSNYFWWLWILVSFVGSYLKLHYMISSILNNARMVTQQTVYCMYSVAGTCKGFLRPVGEFFGTLVFRTSPRSGRQKAKEIRTKNETQINLHFLHS